MEVASIFFFFFFFIFIPKGIVILNEMIPLSTHKIHLSEKMTNNYLNYHNYPLTCI